MVYYSSVGFFCGAELVVTDEPNRGGEESFAENLFP